MHIQVKQSEILSINYEAKGSGLDIVLVHGLGLSSMNTWVNQVPELSKYYRVHTYDVRGFGKTNNPLNDLGVEVIHSKGTVEKNGGYKSIGELFF